MRAGAAEPPLLRTPGIVLRIQPFSRTSHAIHVLTPDRGRMALMAKGAQRPRSGLRGHYDLFYDCEWVLHLRPGRGAPIVRECAAILPPTHLRTAWRDMAVASYACDLILRSVPEGAAVPGLHAALRTLLSTAPDGATAAWLRMLWLELRLLEELGLRPRLDACVQCGATEEQTPLAIAPARGGAICEACLDRGASGIALHLPPAALAGLCALQVASDPTQTPALEEPLCRIASAVLDRLLRHHLELEPGSRDVALRIVTEREQLGAASA